MPWVAKHSLEYQQHLVSHLDGASYSLIRNNLIIISLFFIRKPVAFYFSQFHVHLRRVTISEMDLENKVLLVTGGARGLGLAYGKELLRNGVKLAILDLATSVGEESVKKLNAEFGEGRAIFIPCDVTKDSEFEAGFTKTVTKFGGIDIVINNAGVLNERKWEFMIATNFNAVVRGTLLGQQYMGKDRGGKGGVIVNIASILGLDLIEFCPVYAGTKHAILGFTRSFGTPYHFERTGIRFLTMCPGMTETPMLGEFPKTVMDFVDVERAIPVIKRNYSVQKVETAAAGIVELIRSAENGAVWVSEGGETREVLIPDRFNLEVVTKKQ